MKHSPDGAPISHGAPSGHDDRACPADRPSRLAALLRDLAGQVSSEGSVVPQAPVVPLRTVFTRFWVFARPHRALIIAAIGFAIISPLLETISIGFFKVLVDEVLVPRNLEAFWWVALAYVGLTLLAGVVGFGRSMVGALA
ncbi:MAG: hypothetical protein ACRDTG_31980, partial [Pseudonocardiaceae bacterium]